MHNQSGTMPDDVVFSRPVVPALGHVHETLAPLAYPLIRIAAGLLLIPHGAQKLFGLLGGDPVRLGALFEKIGFAPGTLFVPLAGSVEFFGGLLVALGLLTRPAAACCMVLLLVTVRVQSGFGWFWTGGGVEYAVLWSLVMLAILLRGGGRFSLDRLIGREI